MKNYQNADKIQLVFSGSNYFDILEQIIHESKEVIHLQTYIFEDDQTGQRIANALKQAVARKVKVFMLIDAYGSYPFSKKMKGELKQQGINFRLYSPLLSSESIYFGRRLHHKIIVADKKVALTGGINIADKYSGENGEEPWLDYAVLTHGDVCHYLHLLCEMFYKKGSSSKLREFEKPTGKTQPALKPNLRFRRNDWIKGMNEIHKSYMEAIISSTKCITIVASYFLPGSTFRKLLKSAASRGVEIRIILAGKSDIPSVRLAEHFMYEFYLRHNIALYEWQNSVMHGKAMLVDNKWVTLGSYNLNFLSHYISVELNTDISDAVFAKGFSEHLQDIIKNNCSVVDLKRSEKKISRFERFKMKIAYYFYRMVMHVLMNGRKYKTRRR